MQHQFGPLILQETLPTWRRFRGLCFKTWDVNYYNLLELAGLPTLENRRNYNYLKLTTHYKIYHGYFYFPSGNLVPHLGRSNHPSPHSFYLPLTRTNAYRHSFFPLYYKTLEPTT